MIELKGWGKKMRQHKWYEKYIGYCFNDNGREVVLEDIFYYEDDNGKISGTGYEMRYTDNNESFICDYKVFKDIIGQTDLPRI